MLLLPTAALWRTYFSPHQMPLRMHPACSWWCSHRASGSSVWTRQTRGLQWWPAGLVESWVTRREGSENPPRAGLPCGSAKERASDISQHHTFISPDLSPQACCPRLLFLAPSLPESRKFCIWAGTPSFSGCLLGSQMLQTEQDFGGLHSWVSDLACCQLKSPPRRHSPQWGTRGATGKTGKCLWKRNLVLQMALCHIPGMSPLCRPTVIAGCCPGTSPTGIPRGGLNKRLLCPFPSLSSLDWVSPAGMGVSS